MSARQTPARHRRLLAALAIAAATITWPACGSTFDKDTLGTAPDLLVADARGDTHAEIRVSRGDTLNISIFRRSDNVAAIALQNVPVSVDGSITFPIVGRLQVEGLTTAEVSAAVMEIAAQRFVTPTVSVELANPAGQRVFVIGEVANPGVFAADGTTTVVEVLMLAGGFSLDADLSSVVLLRTDVPSGATPPLVQLNLERMVQEADTSNNVVLRKGDIVIVPPTGAARLGRWFGTVFAITQPFVDIFGTIATIILLSRSLK